MRITERQQEWAEQLFSCYSSAELKEVVGDALLASCLNSLVYLRNYNIPPSDVDISPLQDLKTIYDTISELVDKEERDTRTLPLRK